MSCSHKTQRSNLMFKSYALILHHNLDGTNNISIIFLSSSSSKTLLNCIINARDRFSCESDLTTDLRGLMDYIEEVCEEDNPVFLGTIKYALIKYI